MFPCFPSSGVPTPSPSMAKSEHFLQRSEKSKQAYRVLGSAPAHVECKFCASCACPSAPALRMPAWARRRVRCALLRSASRKRSAVSRRVASSWSCQVDFTLSLCFFWRHSPNKLYGRLRTRVGSWRAPRIPLSRVRFLRLRWVWA